ncbi:MAG: AMP-binding protein [Gallionellaceae bacterium]|nr:AMP-binding protein [Gallionellaceae bacterium]
MSRVLSAISEYAASCPDAIALSDGEVGLTYSKVEKLIFDTSGKLKETGARTLGLALDNSPLWAVLDLASISSGQKLVPLPGFFSPSQLVHAISDSGIDLILTDRPEYLSLLEGARLRVIRVAERELCRKKYFEIYIENQARSLIHPGTAKITYTSGTTGQPKGVCLGLDTIEGVAVALSRAAQATPEDRYLSVLPLATLLENIAGLYIPLLAGATCLLLPLEKVGLYGVTKLDVAKMAGALAEYRATGTNLTPQLLQALLVFIEAKPSLNLDSLRFVAVGGAPVSERLLRHAQALNLPVYEGYGLSECASVVSLNTPHNHRVGSVGKPLPHIQLKFGEDGEILVKGSAMLGYSGMQAVDPEEYWPTGDTGFLDESGYLHLTGRKKNIYITSFGRNVAPEWVERELTHHPAIAQAAVFGEGKPWPVAVVVPRNPALVEEAIEQANRELPDYAQVAAWIVADAPFTPENGQLTSNGRLKRDAIWPVYRERIERLYSKKTVS